MSSAVLDTQAYLPQTETYTAYVETVPSWPDPTNFLFATLKQAEATKLYSWDDEATYSSLIMTRQDSLSDGEKLEIIKRAQMNLRADIVDIDPDIRQLVNDNFDALIWK